MKCLVTGGAGFIGSHLCERLLTDGHEVLCVDNLLTGNKKNIESLISNPSFTFIKVDCSQPLSYDQKIDIVFHFASPASPPKYQEYPLETLLVNSVGTYHLLGMAKRNQAIFVFASTSEAYGDPEEHPQKETYWGNVNPVGIRSCYDESKRVGEAFVATYVRKYGVDGRIIRIFNTYGPRMDIDDGRVVTNFIKQILENTPLTVYGDGSQTRSFCYVSDLVSGIVKVSQNAEMKGEIVNLGNPDEMTVLELAKKIKELSGYTGEIVFKDLPEDDPTRRQPDISKAANVLQWQPQISFEEGFAHTFTYFKKSAL